NFAFCPVLCALGDKELITLFGVIDSIGNGDASRTAQYAPKFPAMCVGLQAECLLRFNSNNLYGRLFVEGEALKISPRANFLFKMRKAVHIYTIRLNFL